MGPIVTQACAEAIVHGEVPPFDVVLPALECIGEAAQPCVVQALRQRMQNICNYYGGNSKECSYAAGEYEAYKEGGGVKLCEYTRKHPLPYPKPGKERYIPACQCAGAKGAL
jgi:hypothetical protein